MSRSLLSVPILHLFFRLISSNPKKGPGGSDPLANTPKEGEDLLFPFIALQKL